MKSGWITAAVLFARVVWAQQEEVRGAATADAAETAGAAAPKVVQVADAAETAAPAAPRVVTVTDAAETAPSSAARVVAAEADTMDNANGRVIVAREGSVLETAHAVVAQMSDLVLSLELLSDDERSVLASTPNGFGTDGKRIPWKTALDETLRPVKLRYYEDGRMVKIGPGERVDALYAAQGIERLAANHARITVVFVGGTPISTALRVIQRGAGINMNFDYMKPEHRGIMVEPAVVPATDQEGKTVTVQAAPPEVQTTYATPEGQQVPWRAVLREVLDPIGYTFIEDNGTVKPMPKELEAKFQQDKIDAQPLVTKLIRVHHASPETIIEKLKKLNPIRHGRGFIDVSRAKEDQAKTYKGSSAGIATGASGTQVGAQLGSASFGAMDRSRTPPGLLVADIEENLPVIEGYVRTLDIRERQVLIEALILDVSDSMMKELGVKWSDLRLSYNSQAPYNQPQDYYQVSEDGSIKMKDAEVQTGTDPTTGEPIMSTVQVPDLIKKMISGSDLVNLDDWAGKIAKNRFGVSPISFEAIIKMVQGDSYSRVLGNPTITVGDHSEAILQVGKVTPIEQTRVDFVGQQTPQAVQSVEWLSLQTGVTLWVAPEISADGRAVRLSVHPQITEPTALVEATTKEKNWVVSTRELDTRVTVPSGDTLLLGGLIDSKKINTVSKVPLLGDIPFLGRLFRYKGTSEYKSHLVLLIRPTVLDDENPNTGYEAPSLKVAEPMLKGIGKDLDPTRGQDPIVPKEHALLEKWGLRQAETPAPLVGE